ncbi:hypothetical protein AA313_de0210233 [Arthrobotrys entomopaga]|nr:hypothetical protein AA313_de0210233 [Arthrobotrys entomopaga]
MATQRPEIFPSTTREVICVLTLCSAVATAALGSGALQVALPQIGKYYGINGGDLTWIIASGTLTAGSFLLLCGSLSDIIGRKRMLLFSYAWFSIWNLAAGFAKNDILFDIFRGLAGIGGIPACVGILSSTYQRGTRKNKAFAVLGGFQPLGYVFGIVTGGVATEFLSWQANVWFLAILYTFITISTWFFVPSDKELLEHVRNQELKGYRMSGIPPPALGTIADQSILQLLKRRGNGILDDRRVMVIVTLGFMNFTGILMFWSTLWFQEINKVSPLVTTARYLPQVFGGFLVNLFAAFTLHIIPGKLLLIVGMIAFTGSSLLFALQPAHITYWAMSFPSLCLSVVGADLVYMVSNLFVTESVPNNLKSTAGAVFNTVISLANTIGLGAGAAVANSVANKGPNPGESEEDFLVRTFQSAYWFATGATILGTILCFFVKVGRQGHEKPGDVEDSSSDRTTPGAIGNTQDNETTEKLPSDLGKEIGLARSPGPSVLSLDVDDKISTMRMDSPGFFPSQPEKP